MTTADRVTALRATHGGEFERGLMADGTVVVRLRQSSGEVVAGTGATTTLAVTALERRVEAFATSLPEGA